MTNSNPITQNERLEIIDVLRGLAVCGILIANIQLFSGALFQLEVFRDQAPLADRIAQFLIQFFVGGKFYSIFSFLFGFGFALQIERAEQRGDTEARLFKRRLYWMLVIGFLHAFPLWYGDILSIYAMTGFFLIKFRRTDNSSILRWAVALILFPIITYTLVYVVYSLFFTPAAAAPNNGEAINTYNQIVNFVSTANFPMMLPVNVTLGLPQRYIGLFYEMRFTKILGMFLLGLYAYRMGILQHIAGHLPFNQTSLLVGIGSGPRRQFDSFNPDAVRCLPAADESRNPSNRRLRHRRSQPGVMLYCRRHSALPAKGGTAYLIYFRAGRPDGFNQLSSANGYLLSSFLRLRFRLVRKGRGGKNRVHGICDFRRTGCF